MARKVTRDFEVVRANSWKDKKSKKECKFFSLKLTLDDDSEIMFYNLTILENKKGEEFISFPSRKGDEGKYYSYYFIKFTEDEVEDIINQVNAMLK